MVEYNLNSFDWVSPFIQEFGSTLLRSVINYTAWYRRKRIIMQLYVSNTPTDGTLKM